MVRSPRSPYPLSADGAAVGEDPAPPFEPFEPGPVDSDAPVPPGYPGWADGPADGCDCEYDEAE